MGYSEGACHKCGTPLGMSGRCYTCAVHQEEAKRAARPKCAVCGEPLGKSGLCLNCEGKRLQQELLETRAQA